MTCRRVPWVHPTCTCGAPLQLGVDHGDDELGNPLCPTCSGCGCEPNERNLMNEQELRALPVGAAVRLSTSVVWVKAHDGLWRGSNRHEVTTRELANFEAVAITVLWPVPEPDHSMCARLVPYGLWPDGARKWVLQAPNGKVFGRGYTDDETRTCGYAIPEPEPTVMERAAEVLNHVDLRGNDLGTVFAEALDAAGLLVKDGEQ